MNKKQTGIYLIAVFGLGWALQIAASVLALNGNGLWFRPLLMAAMFTPMIAALIAGVPLKGMGWKPRLKEQWKSWLIAWFFPALLALLGAVLYYVAFPKAFDPSMAYLTSSMGEDALKQLEESGMTVNVLALTALSSSILGAPLVNGIFAVGEEAGWRAALNPALKERYGVIRGRLLGGLIWGVWHWPVIILVGYEYGMQYSGAPVAGPLVFCVFTVSAGILLDWLWDRTRCVWVPALAHGAINAVASLPMMCLALDWQTNQIYGPMMVGIIGGIPLFITAVLLAAKPEKKPLQPNRIYMK